MKWSFIIQQKLKAAFLLTGIMLLIILCTLISRSTIKDIDKSFSSIYQDRLIPAVDLVYLSENLYTKRLLVESYLLSTTELKPAQLRGQLSKQNQAVDSLIRKFEKTFLTIDEAKSLRAFKNRIAEYDQIEQDILHLSQAENRQAGSVVFTGKGSAAFQETIRCLNQLTKIQSIEGQSLMDNSKSESSQFILISTLQIGVAIVIGLLILGLIHNSKIINQERQPFHLN